MSTKLITENVWGTLTAAARAARQPCDVAVAYFAKNASRLLPLPKGSRLVVDASDEAVKSGQTCPGELAKLMDLGVTIHSIPNLHAKVFVLGSVAYVGSANVSGSSATRLVEAVVKSSDTGFVRESTKFVRSLCVHMLTPQVLDRLSRIYVEPRFQGGRAKGASTRPPAGPELPVLRIARLRASAWTKEDEANIEETKGRAERRRKRDQGFRLDHFKWSGPCAFKEGDVVIRVTKEEDARELVSPPGTVIDLAKRGTRTYVYLESPTRRRRSLDTVASKISKRAGAKLLKSGRVADADSARALLGLWAG